MAKPVKVLKIKRANRFKPVVKFIGPFKLAPGDKRNHSFIMPNYIGSVRAMIVATNNGAYGKAEKTIPVKKPLMVLATLPRVLGPTEQVTLPVTVFAMENSIKKVDVKISTNDLVEIKSVDNTQLEFAQPGDQVLPFELSIGKKTGIAKIKVEVSAGGESAFHEIEIDVRTPNPRTHKSDDFVIAMGEQKSVRFEPHGISGTQEGVVEISTLPPMNFHDRLGYLIAYPHGCGEQTTSRAFPQLFVDNVTELGAEKKKKVDMHIDVAIKKLYKFQRPDGGINYWPSGSPSPWLSNYAGHFLLEAEKQGYALPFGMMDDWRGYQKQMARNYSSVDQNKDDKRRKQSNYTQAYRLFTLALAGHPELGAMNRLKQAGKLDYLSEWRLAAAYQLAGKKEVAQDMVRDLQEDVKPYRELSYTYGSDLRDLGMILETHCLLNNETRAKKVFDKVSKLLGSSRWYSTQGVSYALLAVGKFFEGQQVGSPVKGQIAFGNSNVIDINSSSPLHMYTMNIAEINSGRIKIEKWYRCKIVCEY